MKRFTVAEARARFGDVLDEAEAGNPVRIERRGISYLVQREATGARRRARASRIEIQDPAVAAGDWTWTFDGRGLRFRARRARAT
jgi:antitoxin (DNA-binding transcriptional repressor) of toxin-antitoxin stability system